MKKSDFLDTLRSLTEGKQAQELKEILFYLAKFVPWEEYEKIISNYGHKVQKSVEINSENLLEHAKELYERVQNDEYKLVWEYEEYYKDYWHDDDDETLKDCDDLGYDMEQLLRAAMNCAVNQPYSLAAEVFDILFSIEAYDDSYGNEITIEMLFENDLIGLDFKTVLDHYAFAVLMSYRGSERVEKLLGITEISYCRFRMADIRSVANGEIPHNEEFSRQWVEFLINHKAKEPYKSKRYEEMLIDAVKYQGGTAELERFAIKYGVQYKNTYIEVAKTYIEEGKYGDAIRVIDHALSKIRELNADRTLLSEMLLDIGKKTNDDKIFKKGTIEAFNSSADLKHFLKLYDLNDKEILKKAAEDIEGSQKRDSDYYMIRFLNGDYDLVWQACDRDKKFLGWSGSIKGRLLPLFVALLSGKGKIGKCTQKWISNSCFASFSYHSYGYGSINQEHDADLFMTILDATLKPLSAAEYDKYFEWCIKEAEGRTEAVVGGQHRESYYKASAFIVAVAEILIAQGDSARATHHIIRYKDKYPRHSLFQKCLKADIDLAKLGKLGSVKQ